LEKTLPKTLAHQGFKKIDRGLGHGNWAKHLHKLCGLVGKMVYKFPKNISGTRFFGKNWVG
jgi:hypothetical protein